MLSIAAPAFERLEEVLRAGSVDDNGIGALLDQAVKQVEANARKKMAVSSIAVARGADDLTDAVIVYDDEVRREAGIAALMSGLDRYRNDTRAAQQTAVVKIILAAANDSPRAKYIDKFVDQLQSSGMTSAIKRGLSREQLDGIREIIGSEKPVRKPKSLLRPVAVEIPQPTLTPWTILVDPIPGYRFLRRPVDRDKPEDVAILKASLPPMPSIEAYERGAAVTIANLSSESEKAKFAWMKIKDWLAKNLPADDELLKLRWRAWTFLLGHVHGYLTDVNTFDEVSFASPWQVYQIVVAARV